MILDFSDKIADAKCLLADHFSKHRITVLQFSGGKDSIACLLLTKQWWDQIIVLWASSGDDLPETIDLMVKIKSMVPNFLMVRGNADLDQLTMGWPVDMLPQNSRADGIIVDATQANPKLRMRYDCCSANVWAPLMRATQQSNASLVIRGQRNEERLKNPLAVDGAVINGITYCLPLQGWSAVEVHQYIDEKGMALPKSYDYELPSMDCMHCTAYLHENKNKLRYLRDYHPAQAIEVKRRLSIIDSAQRAESEHMRLAIDCN